jgi:Lipopolysaccharide export system permease LptF/LptG
MIPGRVLHRIAAHSCSSKALERVVEPAIADLQVEWARADHAPGRLLSILIDGYIAVLGVIAMSAIETLMRVDDERRALARTFLWSAGATMGAVAVLIVFTVAALPGIPAFLVALIVPTMLPIAIAVGVTLGIACGLAGQTVSHRVKAIVLFAAVLSMVASFGAMRWSTSIPLGNSSLRQSVATALRGRPTVTKGLHEMSLAEAGRQPTLAPGGDLMNMPRRLAWTYHFQPAIAFAPLLLAVLSLSLVNRGARRALVMSTCAAYLVLLVAGEQLVYKGLPPLAGAWLANIVFALAIGVLFVSSGRRAARISVV